MRKAGSSENLSGKPRVPSEKHDLLYSKARYVLNQRHIKRPWFNLNPFLERTDESADLENWLPGESKYIQPLESLVLCESFHSDHPIDTRELSIDAFFPYLLSGDWDKGCSVRVLEGQLLERLLLGLYRLEREGVAVRHTTYAFARNSRPRTGCYKLTEKEFSGSIEETMLLEFAHFGRLTKEKPNPTTLNTFEYLQHEKTDLAQAEEAALETEAVSDLPTLQEMTDRHRNKTMNISTDPTKGSDLEDSKPKWGRRGSLMSKHVKAIGFIAAMQTGNRRQSIAAPSLPEYRRQSATASTPQHDSRRQSIAAATTRFQEIRRKTLYETSTRPEYKRQTVPGQTLTNDYRRQSLAVPPSASDRSQFSSKSIPEKKRESATDRFAPQLAEDDELKHVLPKVTKRRFLNRIYSLDFDDDYLAEEAETKGENEESCSPEEKDVFFGEELYLSDQKTTKLDGLVSAEKILQQKKIELQKRREEARRLKKMRSENLKESRLPILFPLDLENLDSYQVKHETIKLPEDVPTLEDFVQLLREDEYYDPRYRNKMRQKSKRIAQRYYIAKGMHRSSVMFSLANLPDEIKNITGLRHTSRKSLTVPLKKRESVDGRSKGHLDRMPTLHEPDRNRRNKSQLPEVKASGSIGSLQERAQEVLVVTDSEPCKDHYMKHKIKSLASIPSAVSDASPIFPRISMCEDESESSDTDTDESVSNDNLDDTFDTKKLNRRYSVERLRKKRRNKIKKKPAFIEVLAKYYNMQNALRAFRKGSAGKETKRARVRAKHLGRKIQQAIQNQQEEMVIGKLRKFSFLEVKPKKKLNLDNLPRGDFSSPDLAKFHQHLNEALDQFVIRREIVVSDLQTFYNATTSVTFTKVACFQHKDSHH